MSGMTVIPSEAALAGSMSDAESVTTATRLTVRPSLLRCPVQVPAMLTDGEGPDVPGTLIRDGPLAVVGAPRHVHAPLQHGPDRDDAHLLPRQSAEAPGRPRPGPWPRVWRRRWCARIRRDWCELLRDGAGPIARLRRPFGSARPLARHAVRAHLRDPRGRHHLG